MKSEWIEFKGKKIHVGKYNNFEKDINSLKAEVEQVKTEILGQPYNSVLSLVDVTNTISTPEINDFFKKYVLQIKKHIRKIALLGVSGFRLVIAKAIAHFGDIELESFVDIEAAKEWLVED